MGDTQRTQAALAALFADNVTGNITPQNLRDFMVTVMNSEFVNGFPSDFWRQPEARYATTDKTMRGWFMYSQIMANSVSFGRALYLTLSGTWDLADCAASAKNAVLGLAADSYATNNSQATIFRRGVVYDSALSAALSGFLGRNMFLGSGTTTGQCSVTSTTAYTRIVGYVVASDNTTSSPAGKWFFDPNWGVSGI